MPTDTAKPVHYKRSRFSTYLPQDRLYAPSHFWMKEEPPGVWRVGFTKFATRMLGDIVECRFDAKPDEEIATGDVIGYIEAFKAVSDLYSIVDGNFLGMNPALLENYSLVSSFPYDKGWMYEAKGNPDERCMDVNQYILLLNNTIDKMQDKEEYQGEPDEES